MNIIITTNPAKEKNIEIYMISLEFNKSLYYKKI